MTREDQPPRSSGSSQRVLVPSPWFWLVTVGCVLLVLTAYSNFFHQSFKSGDRQVIQHNLYIQSFESITKMFSDPRGAFSLPSDLPYQPVLSLSFALDHWIAGGLDPWQFHFTQFLLVAILGLGFALFSLFILDRAAAHWSNKYVALVAGLLCCVHLANVEMLHEMSSRASLLATLGIVGSFLMYGCLPTWRPSHLYLFPMMCGALAHPIGVLFAPLLFVYVVLFEKKLSCRELCSANVRPKIQHAIGKVLPTCLTALALLVFLDSVTPLHRTGGETFSDSVFLQPGLWLYAMERFFVPFGIHKDLASLAPFIGFDWRFLGGVMCLMLLGRIAWVCSFTKERRSVTFGIIWFILGMVVTVTVGEVEAPAGQVQGLFPFMGLILAVLSWVSKVIQTYEMGLPKRNALVLSMICVAGVLVLSSHLIGPYQHPDKELSEYRHTEVSAIDRPTV